MSKKSTKTVTITLADANAIIDLFDCCESADANYKPCQSTLFRNFVVSATNARNTQKAAENIKAAIHKANEEKPELEE